MRARLVMGAVSALTLAAVTACSGTGSDGGAASTSGGGGAAGEASAAASAAAPAAESGFKDAAGSTHSAQDAAVVMQRSIIRTASLTVRTPHVADNVTKAEDATKAAGGLIGAANLTTDPDHPDQTTAKLQLRVPGAGYDQLMAALGDLGQVVHKTEQAQDVTSQVVDVNSRLETQRKSLEQVRALLGRAGTLSQVLLVERDLTRREADLESLEQQRKVLADQTALATIDLTLVTPTAVPPPPPPKRQLGFTTGVISGWHAFTRTAAVTATAIGALLPFLVPVLIVLFVLFLLWRRHNRTVGGTPATADAD